MERYIHPKHGKRIKKRGDVAWIRRVPVSVDAQMWDSEKGGHTAGALELLALLSVETPGNPAMFCVAAEVDETPSEEAEGASFSAHLYYYSASEIYSTTLCELELAVGRYAENEERIEIPAWIIGKK